MSGMIKKIAVAGIMMVVVVAMASAYGGGGAYQGTQVPIPGYSNIDTVAAMQGGYGYGASRSGSRYGGFGVSITNEETGEFMGAFGGVITGRQIRTGPFTLSANVWSGVGYATAELVPVTASLPGAVAFLAEATVEAGLAVLPWLQISAYGGYQAIGTFDMSAMFSNTRYTPIVGTRVTWGGF